MITRKRKSVTSNSIKSLPKAKLRCTPLTKPVSHHYHYHTHYHNSMSTVVRLADKIRKAQEEAADVKNWHTSIQKFDVSALENYIIKQAESKPDEPSCHVKFDTSELTGFKQLLNLDQTTKHYNLSVLWWKEFEYRNGIRVEPLADQSGLNFTWLARDGKNADTFKEPKGIEEIISDTKYASVLAFITQHAPKPVENNTTTTTEQQQTTAPMGD
jgi:hypothetical protein